MWQSAHARASGRLPCATMSGIAGWSPGNQSAGPKPSEICWRVKLSVLPGSVFIDVSGGGGVGAGAPAGRAAGIAYAQAGGSLAARSTLVITSGATTSTRHVTILRIGVLRRRVEARQCSGRVARTIQEIAPVTRGGAPMPGSQAAPADLHRFDMTTVAQPFRAARMFLNTRTQISDLIGDEFRRAVDTCIKMTVMHFRLAS